MERQYCSAELYHNNHWQPVCSKNRYTKDREFTCVGYDLLECDAVYFVNR